MEVKRESPSDIAEAALNLLKGAEFSGGPVKLAKLGGKLSARFQPWRERMDAVGGLRRLLEIELKGQALIEGEGQLTTIRLLGPDESALPPRFDKTVWAAFAKPLPSGKRRYLRISHEPFGFVDTEGDTQGDAWLEVPGDLIASPDEPKSVRDSFIADAIRTWCARHGIDPETLVLKVPADQQLRVRSEPTTSGPGDQSGVQALLRLINAIPPEERSRFSLPIDLVHRLISQPE